MSLVEYLQSPEMNLNLESGDRMIDTIVCGIVNAYLVRGDNASILIDTGTSKYKEKVLECCKNKNIKLIVLTHGHYDHCQNAAYLAYKLNCSVGIARDDMELIENNHKRKVFGKNIWGKMYARLANRNIKKHKIQEIVPDVILENEMSLLDYGIDGKIIGLPGHTKGSIGVMLMTGELLVGDAMQNIVAPSATWCFEDYQQSVDSTERILKTHAKIFYGHGKCT